MNKPIDPKVICPQCRKQYTLKESQLLSGPIKVRCPNCHQIWVVGEKPARREEKVPPVSSLKFPLENFISLRVLVAFLGEKPQLNWWDTNFLSPIGQKYLQIIFPRTSFSAGLNSIAQAAKRVHDDRIGKGGAYHLFRLPEYFEQKIPSMINSADPSTYLALIQSKESALKALESMINGNPLEARGPVHIGTIGSLRHPTLVSEMAGYYYSAFISEQQVFPYVTQALHD